MERATEFLLRYVTIRRRRHDFTMPRGNAYQAM